MKGKILNINENEGIILGENNQRYTFQLNDWKGEQLPQKGEEVDFLEEGNSAKEIYPITQNSTSITKLQNIEPNIRLLGGIGSILLLLSWVPYIGFILYITGLVLLTIALKKLSDKMPEKGIFTKWIITFVLGIATIILMGFVFGAIIAMLGSTSDNELSAFGGMALISIISFIVINIILGILYKKIFYGVAEVTNENLFRTAGMIFFIGGILSIIFLGYLLFFIGWILVAIAFFSIKTENKGN